MPHSGGRVGKGIYFASENGKSAGYGKVMVPATAHPLTSKIIPDFLKKLIY